MSKNPPVQSQQHFKQSIRFEEGKNNSISGLQAAELLPAVIFLCLEASISSHFILDDTQSKQGLLLCDLMISLFDPRVSSGQNLEGH